MKTRIVTDSSSNLFDLPDVSYACVPMKIITRQAEYADTPELDVAAMVEALRREGGPSGSSCPNVHEWLTAFGDADEVFAVTITGTLSGSHSAAVQARRPAGSSSRRARSARWSRCTIAALKRNLCARCFPT